MLGATITQYYFFNSLILVLSDSRPLSDHRNQIINGITKVIRINNLLNSEITLKLDGHIFYTHKFSHVQSWGGFGACVQKRYTGTR